MSKSSDQVSFISQTSKQSSPKELKHAVGKDSVPLVPNDKISKEEAIRKLDLVKKNYEEVFTLSKIVYHKKWRKGFYEHGLRKAFLKKSRNFMSIFL